MTPLRKGCADGDLDYDTTRKPYNAAFDKRPRLIAQCADATDVMASVKLARETGLSLAVRGGGQNGAALGNVDDGLLVDMSQISDVRVDPRAAQCALGKLPDRPG